MIRVIEITNRSAEEQFPDTRHVRFEVDAPVFADPDGGTFRLAGDEGWIDVMFEDGGLMIRGAHVLAIEPQSGNSIVVRLRSSDHPVT